MGRWAQQRRRGGGGGAPPQPPTLISLTRVQATDPTTYTLIFSAPVTYDNSGDLDNFTVDAVAPDPLSVVQTAPDQFTCVFSAGTNSGLLWQLTAQPTQITEPLNVPDAGTTV